MTHHRGPVDDDVPGPPARDLAVDLGAPTGPARSVDNGPPRRYRYEGRAGRSVEIGGTWMPSGLPYADAVPPAEPARWWTLVLAAVGGYLTRLAFPAPGWWG